MILTADQIRARVDADWPQILGVVEDRIALRPISAHGINGEHMRKSAEYVANKLREVGVDAKAVQARDKDGNPSAWEVIGSLEVNPNAPTVMKKTVSSSPRPVYSSEPARYSGSRFSAGTVR